MPLEIPAWSDAALNAGSVALAALVALWILVKMRVAWLQRSYNLLRGESARQGGLPRPEFLHSKTGERQEAIDRGDAYAAARAEAGQQPGSTAPSDPPSPRAVSWLASLAATGSLVASVVNVSVGLVAAFVLYRTQGQDAPELSECWEAVFNRYWLGIASSLCLIVFELWRWVARITKSRS